jgi:hypothetical protein
MFPKNKNNHYYCLLGCDKERFCPSTKLNDLVKHLKYNHSKQDLKMWDINPDYLIVKPMNSVSQNQYINTRPKLAGNKMEGLEVWEK